ncbi:MAG: alpha/beta hydrolase, partial [Actinomycetota bacterium]|nr:alpha/beta hydrolase [Actinomycetota bacterium]
MTTGVKTFIHRFTPPKAPDALTLLLLHGTGGTEDDLLELGHVLDEQAALLSPRGQVSEHGANRW